MNRFLIILLSLFVSLNSSAQIISDPSTWTYAVKKKKDNTYDLVFKVKLKEHWHIWAFEPGWDGLLIPPSFDFDKNDDVKLIGKVKEIRTKICEEVDGEEADEHSIENNVTYIQTVQVAKHTKITGTHRYHTCD